MQHAGPRHDYAPAGPAQLGRLPAGVQCNNTNVVPQIRQHSSTAARPADTCSFPGKDAIPPHNLHMPAKLSSTPRGWQHQSDAGLASVPFSRANGQPITVSAAAHARAQCILSDLELAQNQSLHDVSGFTDALAQSSNVTGVQHSHSNDAGKAADEHVQLPDLTTGRQQTVTVSRQGMQRAIRVLAEADYMDTGCALQQHEPRAFQAMNGRAAFAGFSTGNHRPIHVSRKGMQRAAAVLEDLAGPMPPDEDAVPIQPGTSAAEAVSIAEPDSLQKALIAGSDMEDMLWEPDVPRPNGSLPYMKGQMQSVAPPHPAEQPEGRPHPGAACRHTCSASPPQPEEGNAKRACPGIGAHRWSSASSRGISAAAGESAGSLVTC